MTQSLEANIRKDGLFRGEDKRLVYYLNRPEDVTPETTWAIHWYLRDSPEGPILLDVRGVVQGDNSVLVQLVAADTEDLPPDAYYYALWRTNPGNRALLRYGSLHLQRA